MAIVTETLEGSIDRTIWYHYDVANDVLYLRLLSARDTPTVAEETDDGLLLLRCESDDRIVGLTVVNWWKRFGNGRRTDSIRELERSIEPWAARLAA
ncbi:MAG: DUF2283 domain-containing protein [Planctomycetota bacterium]|jgi:hypothetical protein